MKALIFDTGPIISLTLNNLLWILEPLKKKFSGEFFITPGVYDELIEKPLKTKKYKFEALQILPYISKGVLNVLDEDKIRLITANLLDKVNTTFKANGNWIRIIHQGETEVLASALHLGSTNVVIDERTSRKLIEDPDSIASTLSNKLHTKIDINQENLGYIKKELSCLKVIRSTELAVVAYKMGLLDRYMLEDERKIIKNLDEAIVEGVLWGIKLNGCSIRKEEIYKIIKMIT
ncbi:MAG: hypothetical protein ABIG89_05505 [Candidatus Woesearchaeota archaeon]